MQKTHRQSSLNGRGHRTGIFVRESELLSLSEALSGGSSGKIKPIFAGAAADLAASGALTDITEREARLPNERWSELSAYYKIWREGPRSEAVGFSSYRR